MSGSDDSNSSPSSNTVPVPVQPSLPPDVIEGSARARFRGLGRLLVSANPQLANTIFPRGEPRLVSAPSAPVPSETPAPTRKPKPSRRAAPPPAKPASTKTAPAPVTPAASPVPIEKQNAEPPSQPQGHDETLPNVKPNNLKRLQELAFGKSVTAESTAYVAGLKSDAAVLTSTLTAAVERAAAAANPPGRPKPCPAEHEELRDCLQRVFGSSLRILPAEFPGDAPWMPPSGAVHCLPAAEHWHRCVLAVARESLPV